MKVTLAKDSVLAATCSVEILASGLIVVDKDWVDFLLLVKVDCTNTC